MRPYEYTPRLLCVHIHTLATTQALGGCTAGPFKGSVAEEVVPIRCAARLHATLVASRLSQEERARAVPPASCNGHPAGVARRAAAPG